MASLNITLLDKDLSDKSDDPIGTISSVQLLAEPPGKDGWIHLTDGAAILDVAIELRAVAKPLTAEECRALADHMLKLAEAAGQTQAVEKLKTLSTDDLRACVSSTSRTQFDCAMRAADLGAVSTCK